MQKRAYLRWFSRPADEEVDWEAIYTEILPRVYNFFLYRLDDQAAAEDLTAATLERAWQGRTRYQNRLSDFSTWVFGIARHIAADHFRHRHRTLSFEQIPEQPDDAAMEDTIQRRNEIEHLLALLVKLSEREQEIIALKYGAECSNQEIAQAMHLSETNVSTLVYRIVAKLRAEWLKE